METASMSMPAARAVSDAVLDVLLWLGLWLGLWLFLWEPPSVVGGDGARGGETARVSVARRTSPVARGTSDVIMAAVWVIVVDMGARRWNRLAENGGCPGGDCVQERCGMTWERRCRVDGRITECWTVVVSEEREGSAREEGEDGERGDDPMAYASGASLSVRRQSGVSCSKTLVEAKGRGGADAVISVTARRHVHVTCDTNTTVLSFQSPSLESAKSCSVRPSSSIHPSGGPGSRGIP